MYISVDDRIIRGGYGTSTCLPHSGKWKTCYFLCLPTSLILIMRNYNLKPRIKKKAHLSAVPCTDGVCINKKEKNVVVYERDGVPKTEDE